MDIWNNIRASRVTPDDFIAIIEIPKGSKIKYKFDENTLSLLMDRILYTSTHYPANYGLIPRTAAEDGDSLDVFVLCSEDLHPMSLVKCYPIGIVSMIDAGLTDDKIIAIPFGDPNYNEYRDISELPEHIIKEMSHFFSVYKALEGKSMADIRIDNAVCAREVLRRSILHYKEMLDAE